MLRKIIIRKPRRWHSYLGCTITFQEYKATQTKRNTRRRAPSAGTGVAAEDSTLQHVPREMLASLDGKHCSRL
jgi:hypothetical protein